jgi:hypothetical protein
LLLLARMVVLLVPVVAAKEASVGETEEQWIRMVVKRGGGRGLIG